MKHILRLVRKLSPPSSNLTMEKRQDYRYSPLGGTPKRPQQNGYGFQVLTKDLCRPGCGRGDWADGDRSLSDLGLSISAGRNLGHQLMVCWSVVQVSQSYVGQRFTFDTVKNNWARKRDSISSKIIWMGRSRESNFALKLRRRVKQLPLISMMKRSVIPLHLSGICVQSSDIYVAIQAPLTICKTMMAFHLH